MDIGEHLFRRRLREQGLVTTKELGMNADELKELARMGKAAMNANLFTVRPIANGFLMDYDDVEEYEVNVPVFPMTPDPRKQAPTMEKKTKYRITRKEVFCLDAGAIKNEVDRALAVAHKIKVIKAQEVLLGETDTMIAGLA